MTLSVRCFAVLILTSICSGVEYYLAPEGFHSCNSVCNEHKKICAGTGHGFPTASALPLYQRMGITCGDGNKTATYSTPDSPNYKVLEFETYDQCNGYQRIPDVINCSSIGEESTRRLCPCVDGLFIQFQFIETLLGANNVIHFEMDGQLYLAFSRLRAYRRYQTGTQLYRLQGNDFIFSQTLKSTYSGPGRPSYFDINGEHFIALPYFVRSTSSKRASKTVIFNYYRGFFDAYQELDAGTALATNYIEIKSYKLLVIQGYQAITIFRWSRSRFTKHQVIPIRRAYVSGCTSFKPNSGDFYLACAVWGGNKKSLVFKWIGKRFVVHQRIHGLEYAVTAEILELDDGQKGLVIAKRQRGYRAKMNVVSPVFLWNDALSQFQFDQGLSIPTEGASACRPFKINNELFLVVAQSASKASLIYKYKEGKFRVYQELKTLFADDVTFFTYQRIHYLIFATQGMGYSPAFIWN